MHSDPTATAATRSQRGFTLIEVLVAMAILAIVLLGFLTTRSRAMADAIQARNWRLARSIAEEKLSTLMAGANEYRPDPTPVDVEDYAGFRYAILIGEEAIAAAESEQNSYSMNEDGGDFDRRIWQQERNEQRIARQKGKTVDDYRRDQLQQEAEDANAIPSESEFEEVAVIVYFPNISLDTEDVNPEETFTLKARVSTLAIHGLTPDQAKAMADSRGVQVPGSSGASSGAGGAPGSSGVNNK